jgi:hypothetical protein
LIEGVGGGGVAPLGAGDGDGVGLPVGLSVDAPPALADPAASRSSAADSGLTRSGVAATRTERMPNQAAATLTTVTRVHARK